MNKSHFIPQIIATGLGCGFCPIAPGTAGAILATLLWWLTSYVVTAPVLVFITAAMIVLCTLAGTWATKQLEPYWGADPSKVVIDEMIGVWIPLLITPAFSIKYMFLSLVLFRAFDIIKPFGIRLLDNKKGAFWVMADDILAGIYSLLTLFILQKLI